jgi:hypothetical protein
VGFAGTAAVNMMGDSERRHREYVETPVHEDKSQVAVVAGDRGRRMVKKGEIEFILRRGPQGAQRVIVARSAADEFVNSQLGYIDQYRQRLKGKVSRDLAAVFEQAFADRQKAVNKYADWFFAWGRSWQILYQAVAGGINELPKVGISRTKVTEAARIEVEAFMLQHYKEFVLKPEIRDPLIASGVERILRETHQEFLFMLSSLDNRLTEFLKKHTRHAEPLERRDVQRIALDWEAQRWKTPRTAITDQYQRALTGVATIAGSTMVLGPILESTVLPLLAEIVGEALLGFELTITGAVMGSEVPLLGNLVGGGIGAGADYLVGRFREHMDRDDFVKGNRAAIDATMREWREKVGEELHRLVDVWMDDSQAAVALGGK